jgi:hypothetical protein
MSFKIGRHQRFHGSKSLFPNHETPATLTTTEIGSDTALRSYAARANAHRYDLPLSRGRRTRRPTRVHTYSHEANTMQVFVDLKVCESCGSLWYRAAGEVKIYCGACAVKLGEFPLPRLRRRPGGRRKLTVTRRGISQVSTGGGR